MAQSFKNHYTVIQLKGEWALEKHIDIELDMVIDFDNDYYLKVGQVVGVINEPISSLLNYITNSNNKLLYYTDTSFGKRYKFSQGPEDLILLKVAYAYWYHMAKSGNEMADIIGFFCGMQTFKQCADYYYR